MGGNPSREESDSRGAPHEPHPTEAGSPLPPRHTVKGAERRFDKRAHKGVNKLSCVTSTDGGLETDEDDGDREISNVKMILELFRRRHRGGLSRNPSGYKGELRAGWEGSTLEVKTSLLRGGKLGGPSSR